MRRAALTALAVCAGLIGLAGPSLADSQILRDQSAHSEALGGPLDYSLYLPPSYKGGELRFPTIYLLHGYGGGASDWLDAGGLAATADRLIAQGRIPETIVVMPALGNNWYVDNPDPGGVAAETALATDLREHIDQRYRTLPRRESRAIAGLSMGGYGAIRLALHRPDLYVAAASLSGAILTDLAPGEQVTGLQLELFGPVFGKPFDPARFNAANVFAPLSRFDDPAEVPPIYLASGDDDYFGLHHGAMALFAAMEARGNRVELRITDGGHTWELWAKSLPDALIFLGAQLAPAE